MPTWASREGSPRPFGAVWVAHERAFNFAISSRNADSVTLLLYVEEDLVNPVATHHFDPIQNRSGRTWHCRLPEAALRGATLYAYKITGPEPRSGSEWSAFDPQKILLDPYVKSVFIPPTFSRQAAMDYGSNRGRAMLGVLEKNEAPFPWDGDRRTWHESDMVIYELHVRGFTRNPNSGVAEVERGTYTGLIHKIPYLQELGVTAVELMPVFQVGPQENNYWGYMPLSFFALHQGYACSCRTAGHKDEFREMVKAFHAAGIEVILDVVFNHTAEGDQRGPTYNFKGIDNAEYYILSNDPDRPYENFSGTGNSLKVSAPPVREMIIDSLRYWVNEMHVDGFRYDLASVGVRNADGSINADPAISGEIRAVPELYSVRHIVEPWDVGMGGYLLGKAFPGSAAWQWNGKFRDDVRRFVRGDPGMVGPLMARLYGSDDLFPDVGPAAYHPYQSVNYICAHDGFTMYDLVSYNTRRNWANGHNNTDGPADDLSWNCGCEGDDGLTDDVLALRKRQIKNLCSILFLANGTPMFRSGDEGLRTQHGNNNPYNQDNESTWFDWSRLETHGDIFRFFQKMIAFRKAHPSIARSRFWRDDVRWYGFGRTVDFSPESRHLAYFLNGAVLDDDDLYVMLNAHWQACDFTIQEPGSWRRIVDTSLASPYDIGDAEQAPPLASPVYAVGPRSVVVLLRPRATAGA